MAHKQVSKYEKEVIVTDDPFKELLGIMDIESDGKTVGWRLRRDALDKWKDKWLYEAEAEISVLKPEMFQSEHRDLILDKLAEEMAKELTEQTKFVEKSNKLKSSMTVIRRSPKK